tara:strand:- start:881 stop:1225 length:345 start_codon:yes stop_codon:yes gene_type:complete
MEEYKIVLIRNEDDTPKMTSIGDTIIRFTWNIIEKATDTIIGNSFNDMSIEDVETVGELLASKRKKAFKDIGESLLEEYIEKSSNMVTNKTKVNNLESAFSALGDVSSTKSKSI